MSSSKPMKMTAEDKVIRHRLHVLRQEDRCGFEIRLPSDTEAVTGLRVSARPGPLNRQAAGALTRQTGQLTLRWNMAGDIFFQGEVWHGDGHEENYSMMGLSAPDGFLNGTTGFGIRGGKIEPLKIVVPGNQQVIRGYYVDSINRMGGKDEPYTVDLFLSYRRARR